ncbi:nuclear pore protein 84/107 [Chytriomyces sp. MP71]|nr:nuclear pore protein 84/107 [Chytriomyces sp. MP71]
MDPDGPSRTRTALSIEDAKYESSMTKTLYSYVRRGRLWEAMDLCRASDEPWRAASFAGARYFTDDFVDGESEEDFCSGNTNRDLWKVTCLAIAKEPTFDPYERAVYAALAGNVEYALPVCKTWEDYVWLHYNYYVEHVVEQQLATVPLAIPPNDEFQSQDAPEVVKLPADLFDWLSRSENPDVQVAAQNPFRIFQAMIILDRIDPLLMSVHHQLVAGSNAIAQLPTVLRFLVHMILALRSVSYPITALESSDFIIKTYIDLLIAARMNSVIAIYVGQLPSALQVECYAQFLQGNTEDKFVRKDYIVQGADCGINMQKALKRTVELAFHSGIFLDPLPARADAVYIAPLDTDVSDASYKHIRALEWLLFDPGHKADAVVSAARLIRRCLVHGHVHVARHVLAMLPAKDAVEPRWRDVAVAEAEMLERRDIMGLRGLDPVQRVAAHASVEYTLYAGILDCFEGVVEWTRFFGLRPLKGLGDSDALTTFAYRDWLQTLEVHEFRFFCWKWFPIIYIQAKTEKISQLLRGRIMQISILSPSDGGLSGAEGAFLKYVFTLTMEYRWSQAKSVNSRFN